MSTILHILYFLTLFISITASNKNTTTFWQDQFRQPINFQSFVGYQNIDWYFPSSDAQMYYNLIGAYHQDIVNSTDGYPLLIWLLGGPGYGSQLGAFSQISPIRIVNGKVTLFDHPWNILSHLVFVDSPLNTGFSKKGDRFGKDQVNTTNQATNHLCNFLYNFYKQFPNLVKSPLYIGGQSYAGHYIPSFAVKIINNRTKLNQFQIDFKGILIGGGWVDPLHQLNHYDSYLWSVGIAQGSFREQLTWHQTHSTINILDFHYRNATEFIDFIISNKTTHEVYMGNVSTWNFRNYDGIDTSFVKFLNDNKNVWNVTADYIHFNEAIYEAFKNDVTTSFAGALCQVLLKIKALIYNGQNDIVVNNAGVLTYLNSLHWQGIDSWKKTPKSRWTIYGHVEGWNKISGNLWFAHVNGAGHMVSYDKPLSALVMFGHFLRNQHDWRQ